MEPDTLNPSIFQREADAVFDEVVRLRRHLHRHPELAFEEHETAQLVAETLRGLDVEVQTEVNRTGVVGTLRGGAPGPTLALRADMDALPIHEENGFAFKSEHGGKMHACGHDGHTSSLLGTAMILARLRDRLPGTVRFIFQPSEERTPGGAPGMIEAGVLDGVDAIFGQHVEPELDAGMLGVRSGSYMASADELYITLRTDGGHAAAPHRLAGDAVLASAHVLTALQSVVSRACPPGVPSVLSIGKVEALGATNVLPETARMEGTFRAMDESWRFRAHEVIRRVVEHTAQALGATAEVEIAVGYPALVNDEDEAAFVRKAAEAYVGPERVVDLDRWYAAEDFAFYLQEKPGAFYRLGVRNEAEGIVHGLHTPRFTLDEEALRTGSGFMAYLAWRRLQGAA